MPAILEDAVKSIMKENPDMKKGAAYAIATSTLQKSGDLKKGTVEATEKGKRRGEMSKKRGQKPELKNIRLSARKNARGKKVMVETSGAPAIGCKCLSSITPIYSSRKSKIFRSQ